MNSTELHSLNENQGFFSLYAHSGDDVSPDLLTLGLVVFVEQKGRFLPPLSALILPRFTLGCCRLGEKSQKLHK